jgi:hypothetical protein
MEDRDFVSSPSYLGGVADAGSKKRSVIPDMQVRYMALHAALVAAEGLTDSELSGVRRMGALTQAYGIVMALRGPGHPVSFEEFRGLVRGPVAGLLPPGVDEGGLEWIYAIDPETDDRSVELEALDSEYGDVARLSGELPHWPWLRGELAERKAFALFRQGGEQRAYERRRSFVIRRPAGTRAELRAMPQEIEDLYGRVPGERIYDRWCFPCPVCRWPMRVAGGVDVARVACDDRGHRERGADYRFVRDDKRDEPPELVRMHQPAVPSARIRRLAPVASEPIAVEAGRVLMVGPECWHSHVVPGLLELALHDELRAKGAGVELWPGLDSYDLRITAGRKREWKVDVKDVISVPALLRRMEGEEGRGMHLVVPDRLSSEVPLLRRTLSAAGWKVKTAAGLATEVCHALGVRWA